MQKTAYILFVVLLLFAASSSAQTDSAEVPMDSTAVDTIDMGTYEYDYNDEDVLLNEEADYDFSDNYGPNRRNYFQPFSGIGFVVGPSDTGVMLNYGLSAGLLAGYRYKLKLSPVFAFCAEAGYSAKEFNVSQAHKNYFLDTTFWHTSSISHMKEKLGYYSIDLGGFFRVNFDPKRGNSIGHFIDLGATGSYIFSKKYVALDEKPDDSRVKTRITRYKFINPFQYELVAKFGLNIFSMTVKYRMTDLFKSRYGFPEFSPLMVGLEIGSLK